MTFQLIPCSISWIGREKCSNCVLEIEICVIATSLWEGLTKHFHVIDVWRSCIRKTTLFEQVINELPRVIFNLFIVYLHINVRILPRFIRHLNKDLKSTLSWRLLRLNELFHSFLVSCIFHQQVVFWGQHIINNPIHDVSKILLLNWHPIRFYRSPLFFHYKFNFPLRNLTF